MVMLRPKDRHRRSLGLRGNPPPHLRKIKEVKEKVKHVIYSIAVELNIIEGVWVVGFDDLRREKSKSFHEWCDRVICT